MSMIRALLLAFSCVWFGMGARIGAAAPAACAAIGEKAAPQPDELPGTVSMTYRYASGRALRLHVRPAAAVGGGPHAAPAIVLFFGGGWLYGSIRQFDGQAQALAAAGITAILADYRVLCRDGTGPPAAMQDAVAAMRFVRIRATSLGIDPHRLAAGGGSAGGQLALSTAFGPDPLARPDALVLFNPVVDLRAGGLAGHFDHFPPSAVRAASPIMHAGIPYPPMLIMHGTDDPLVPIRQVRDFCDAVATRGHACELLAYAGARHGFFNRTVASGRWFAETRDAMVAFLKRSL